MLRTFSTQSLIQSTGLVLLPISLFFVAPFANLYAFYQNASVFGNSRDKTLTDIIVKSFKQANSCSKQNLILVWLLCPLLMILVAAMLYILPFIISLLTFFSSLMYSSPVQIAISIAPVMFLLNPIASAIAVNLASALVILPALLRAVFGIETLFTLSGENLLNTTFCATVLALTYLVLDPLVKTTYSLRCFYGESLHTGSDLKMQLRQVRSEKAILRSTILLALVGFLTLVDPLSPCAQNIPVEKAYTKPSPVSPQGLDRSLDEILTRTKYSWRIPREIVRRKKDDNSVLIRILKTLGDWLRALFKWIGQVVDWFRDLFPDFQLKPPGSSARGWVAGLQAVTFILLALTTCTLAIFLLRAWQQRRKQEFEIAVEVHETTPDIEDENVRANELPSEGWLAMAEDLLETGELRLALRAFFLATLALLAKNEMIALARYKSNRDYQGELAARAHVWPETLTAFSRNTDIFESIWYGNHSINAELLDRFRNNQERIFARATQ